MRDRLGVGLERITFYVALAVGAVRVRRRRHRRRAARSGASSTPPTPGSSGTRSRPSRSGCSAPPDRACSRTASTRSTVPQLVARIAVLRVALAGLIGALLMFPLDRLRHRRLEHPAGRATSRFGPLPDALRLARGRTAPARDRRPGPRRGGVVVGRVPPAAGRARVAHRAARRARPRHPLVAHRRRSASACWRPASGRPPTTCRRLVALVVVVGAAGAHVPRDHRHDAGHRGAASSSTACAGSSRADRPTRLGSPPCSRHSGGGGSTSARRSTRPSTPRPTRRSSSSRPSPRPRTSTGGSASRPPT